MTSFARYLLLSALGGAIGAILGTVIMSPACGQTFSVEPLPPPAAMRTLPSAGYLGIDTSKAAAAAAAAEAVRQAERDERRSQAQRAADRRARQAIANVAPAAGGDASAVARTAAWPHVLWILRREEQTTRTPIKHPTPAAPGTLGAGTVPPLALVMTSELSAITTQVFGDRDACEINLQVIGPHTDPEQVALYCLPQRTK